MKKLDFIGLRISLELKAKLQKEAEKQRRSLSNLIEIILEDYIKEQGEPTPRSERP